MFIHDNDTKHEATLKRLLPCPVWQMDDGNYIFVGSCVKGA